MSGVSCLMGGR